MFDYDYYDMDDYFYGMYRNRLITTEEIDQELNKIFKKENGFLGFRKIKRDLDEKINKLSTKIALYVVKDVMLKEMKKDYYQNIHNIKEVIDINTHRMEKFIGGTDYIHVENLCIWQNGFYNLNCFNIRLPKTNNFNEEIAQELEKLNFHGELVPIEKQDKGTDEDYAKLEAKILKRCKQHESYTE